MGDAAGCSGRPGDGGRPHHPIPLDVPVVRDMALRRTRRRVLRRNALYVVFVAIAVALALGGLAAVVRGGAQG